MDIETWELLSYIVTVIGLPFAIIVYAYEKRRERVNDEEEVFQLLSDNYQEFLRVVLENPDLKLFSVTSTPNLTEEQRERMLIIFDMLMSLFERAYLLVFETNMNPTQARLWLSWEDYMLEWCHREDFKESLPILLKGEDPEFSNYILQLAKTPWSRS